ncbi:glycoside hydrolase family 16 protein [Aureibaculum conchae]|uniref:glycoside hydrolase family 16 protein n=1 Tax=Aureibaculum sp. 2308TA14-22 TaxID=3108392 RepID=UPI0033914879
MKHLLIFLFIIISGCKSKNNNTVATTDVTSIMAKDGYELVWSDEFNKDLDTSKWAYRTDNKHRSIQLKENIQVKDGVLTLNLNVFDEPIQGKKASGAGIVSKKQFRYGYYEVRSRLGDGIDDDNDGKTDEGWHHSFWAMAAVIENGEVGTTYPGIRRTEIDCYENPTEHLGEPEQNGLNNFTQHVIVWDETGKEWGRLPTPPTDVTSLQNFDASKWHTYAFEWDEKEIKFYVDDKLQKVAHYPANKFVHDKINIWLTAIAANWNDDDQEKSMAQYDYFRFYEKSTQ